MFRAMGEHWMLAPSIPVARKVPNKPLEVDLASHHRDRHDVARGQPLEKTMWLAQELVPEISARMTYTYI